MYKSLKKFNNLLEKTGKEHGQTVHKREVKTLLNVKRCSPTHNEKLKLQWDAIFIYLTAKIKMFKNLMLAKVLGNRHPYTFPLRYKTGCTTLTWAASIKVTNTDSLQPSPNFILRTFPLAYSLQGVRNS